MESLKNFIPAAMQQANSQGYGVDTQFTFFIVSSFLLGTDWLQDPAFIPLRTLLTECDADSDNQLRLNHCLHERQRLDMMLPAMHDQTLIVLHMSAENLSSRTVLQHWQAIARLRGIENIQLLTELYFCYYADFCQFFGLADKTEEIRKRAQGKTPAFLYRELSWEDALHFIDDLTFRQRYQFLLHFHLALSFGRFWRINPLHKQLRQAMKTADDTGRAAALIDFLRMYQQRLAENIKDGV
ncbi:hypothetical protein FH403_15770 [Salmonella enterica]|nr:hypothetical protein [Salmonella enterica]ECD9477133.1 hypothetical protein [Salmonella enterica subsp. houtenae]EDY1251506.1 hypothetical protein [Salmonella enterica]EGN1983942.1 hypothetical protein [Salmonella enterica]EGW2264679.1 hypothetical protein [Salmonella enterica]